MPALTQADIFEQLIKIRHSAELFHQKRYSDAELNFDTIYLQLEAEQSRDLDRLSTVLNFLAQSKSFLGKNEEALVLMQRRLEVAREIYGENSVDLAPILAGLAESHFRNNNRDLALELVHQAVAGFERLGDEHAEHLALARTNISRYSTGTFDETNLPADLSEFYSMCESIATGDTQSSVDLKMDKFVELDVDFNPTGFWGAMFEVAAMGEDGKARSGNSYRRIFLPASDESLRSEICVVDQQSGTVTSAENFLD